MKQILKEMIALFAGAVSGFLSYVVTYYIIYFIGMVPLLREIVYFPSGSSWSLFMIPSVTSVLIGAFLAGQISGRMKWYCLAVIVVNLLPVVVALLGSKLGIGLLIRRVLFIVPAVALLIAERKESPF